MRVDRLRRQIYEFPRIDLRAHHIAATKAIVDPNIATLNPIELLKSLPQRRNNGLAFGIFCVERQKGSDTPHPLALLPTCGERPRGCRAAEKRDELAPPHAPPRLPRRREA